MVIRRRPPLILAAVAVVTAGCGPDSPPHRTAAAPSGPPPESRQADPQTAGEWAGRWPREGRGRWVEAGHPDLVGLRIGGGAVRPVEPFPVRGYVPIEAEAPTLRADLTNGTPYAVADVRVRVTVRRADGSVRAEEVTAWPGHYSATGPGGTERRKWVLRQDGPFAGPTADGPAEAAAMAKHAEVELLAARLLGPPAESPGDERGEPSTAR